MDKLFASRLAHLRIAKGVSARDMSLSIGQSAGYINNIENGNNLPSMTVFFYICEYLGVAPSEFFDINTQHPQKLNRLVSDLQKLNEKQLDSITAVVENMLQK